MKPPIIIDEHGDISFFKSIEDAVQYIEPIDVLNNEYIAYDSLGFLLDLIPTKPKVTISGYASQSSASEQLFSTLKIFTAHTNVQPTSAEVASLENLIQFCVKEFGYAV